MSPDDRPALGRAWELALTRRRAFVVRSIDRQPVASLTGFEALTLGLMDGSRRWAEVVELLRAAGGERAAQAAGTLAGRLAALLDAPRSDDSPARSSIPPKHRLEELASVDPPSRADGLRDSPGPRVLHWWVTSVCPRKCVYCFAEPVYGRRAGDATLPRERLVEIFREARTLGASSLLVGGAEPLLRDDLPEVLGDAIAAGVAPSVTTKLPVSRALAARFARAGLDHLSYSLDAVTEDKNRALVGAPSYARQVARSFARLREVGIRFSIQVVVTALAPDDFEDVVEFAAREGAQVVQIVPFEPVRSPIARWQNTEMTLRSEAGLDERVATLSARHPRTRIERFVHLGSGDRGGHHCDIGMTKLFFLPDGTVHRCYKLRDDARLRGRSLLDTSVARAWHDPAFDPVISPPRDLYRDSACSECGRFDDCHLDGRCIYQAMMDHGRYHAPDRRCERSSTALRLRVLS